MPTVVTNRIDGGGPGTDVTIVTTTPSVPVTVPVSGEAVTRHDGGVLIGTETKTTAKIEKQ